MLLKFSKLIKSIIPFLRKRDILYIIALFVTDEIISQRIERSAPFLYTPMSILLMASNFFIMIFIYIARWYKTKSGESLYGAMLSPDREGSFLQLISRARKTYVDIEQNKSKGWNTAINSDGIALGMNEDCELITSPSLSEEHILCIGGSGSGKTTSVLIPTALRFKGGIFAIDISSDIYYNVKQKRNIARIDPHSSDSVSFNVFAHIDSERDNSRKIIMLKRLANLIIPEFDSSRTGDNVYFQQGSHLLFYSSLIFFYSKGLDFCDACYEIVNKSGKELINLLKSKNSPTNARMAINGFADLRDTNLASMKQTLDAYISVFATSRPIKRILHRSAPEQCAISSEELEKRDIFLCIKQREKTFFAPLMKLISGLVLDYCGSREIYPDRKILIALDEFSSLGFIDIINPLANLRKYGTRIMILTQSLADIDNIYGINKRRVIFDNCSLKILLSIKDRDTQEFFSRIIGTYEVIKKSRTYSNGEARHTYTTTERPIISPEEFGYLRDECVVLLPDGYLKLRKVLLFGENL